MGKHSVKKRKVWQEFLLYLNWILIVSLLLAYIAAFLNPKIIAFPQLFGLAYPVILVLNLIFVAFWIYQRKKYFLYSLLAVLLGIGFIGRTFNFSKPKRIYTRSFTVMSYNVRSFNLYKWNGDYYTDAKIFNFIKSRNPDILCLQEFFSGNKIRSLYRFNQLYPYYAVTNKRRYTYGQIIFSKYPIKYAGFLSNNGHNYGVFTDLKIDGQTVRVINVHLRSVALAYQEYNTIDSLKFNNKRLKRLIRKLTSGYKVRQQEARQIAQLIDTTEYPVILCGDFNDTPVSFTYTKISRRLKDAFTVAGLGIGNTYAYYLPILRIDYIFYSNDLHLLDFGRIKIKLSDHFPIWAELAL